jgi:tryptophan synthase beta subunit
MVRAKEGKTRINTYIDPDLKHEVRVISIKKGLTLEDIIDEALRDWIKKNEQGN